MNTFLSTLSTNDKYDVLVMIVGDQGNGFEDRKALSAALLERYADVLTPGDLAPYKGDPNTPSFIKDLVSFQFSRATKEELLFRPTADMVAKHIVTDPGGNGTSMVELTDKGRARYAELGGKVQQSARRRILPKPTTPVSSYTEKKFGESFTPVQPGDTFDGWTCTKSVYDEGQWHYRLER